MPTSFILWMPHRATRIILGVLLVLAATGFSSSLQAQDAQSDKDHRQWQREDIAVFRNEFLARDLAFTAKARRIAERRLAKLERGTASPAPEIDGVVIQLRKTFDADGQKIADFLEEAEAKRKALGRKHVVLDMRFNGGGNFLLVRDFMIRWPARTTGRFFVLTSRQTFSAAIASIAYLKQAGNDRVTIVGEPVGDRMMFFSDGLPVRLPHSGRYFLPAVVRMDYKNGCRRYDDCLEAIAQPGRPVATGALPILGPVARLPVSVATLDPDVPAPWTIDAWLNGTDPMMDAVIASIGESAE